MCSGTFGVYLVFITQNKRLEAGSFKPDLQLFSCAAVVPFLTATAAIIFLWFEASETRTAQIDL